jgi:SRSO17 transposase
VVLGDCGYGDSTEFRDGVSALGLTYLVGVAGNHHVWPPGSNPRAPKNDPRRRGRARTVFRDRNRKPRSILEVASSIDSYREIVWRDGSRASQSGVFAAVRVRSAERRTKGRRPGDEQWLLCEWPRSAKTPQKFYLSTLPANTSLRTLVRFAKLRWRVERDYQEMKQEIGLDHFEGRSWRGFHHHATLCAVAHGFLALRRALFPPESDEVDAADGASPPAAHPASAHRNLPHVQARRPHRLAPPCALAHVIR